MSVRTIALLPGTQCRLAMRLWPQTLPSTAARARRLDLIADIELAHGHHGAAERLAHKAAALREAPHAPR